MANREFEIMPWECRDVEDQAEAYYNQPLRSSNQALAEENAKLKKLLRENGISWSPVSANYQNLQAGARRKQDPSSRTRSFPYLPTEVLLRILKYSMTSKDTIIDPLTKLTPDNLTAQEKSRGNQIAIHFLATCKAMHDEGSRMFWSHNTFTFTNEHAVRNFAELDFGFRKDIKHVNFRIVAQFYDDKKRKHKLERSYHPSLKSDITLRTIPRVSERTYARGGFRCYTWAQVTDFLRALRPPFDPKHDKRLVRPKLLPGLESLRIDLVNFIDDFLPMPSSDLHDVASHELGCSLNELQVTGLPIDDAGSKATAELTGLLRDEGLFLAGLPSFVQVKNSLKPLPGISSCARVVRAWKTIKAKREDDGDSDSDPGNETDEGHYHPKEPIMPPAPRETGHPKSAPSRRDLTIWKRVPKSRDGDGDDRQWTEFCRSSGYPMEDIEDMMGDDDELGICPCCGEPHPSLLDLLETDNEEDIQED
ncbi:hypothetical protein CPAR01_04686 [Colletotrichum paranaense]|uniref:F-box domain-containing protein n=2 Tax=Colletotrichum acutatum species complex TaxID=2707335 RepID=A0ABQ9PWG1_9PEZI|nr:uncharacterized protein CPAR01_04686 [Colletotrichum paranaense]KAK0375882.1 hypothetical protein CLIM01_06782 [Colletotrichum limetticola]KAK1544053.1 hypothetical protein CPAR01_04686 [Colletotrichum paranaense]